MIARFGVTSLFMLAGLVASLGLAPQAAQAQRSKPLVTQPADSPQAGGAGTPVIDIATPVKKAQDAAGAGNALEALDALDDAAATIYEKMPLTVRRALFVAEEAQGFGVFNPRDTNVYDASKPLLVYAELAGYGWRPSGDIYRVELVLDFDLLSKEGQSLVSQRAFNRITTASRARNRDFWFPVSYNFSSGIEPGDYVIRTIVRDVVSQKQTQFDLPFTIKKPN